MTRHWSTRYLGAVLALAFALGMAEAGHQCPVHDAGGAVSTHASHAAHTPTAPDQQTSQQHCTCPQACCHTGVGVALPTVALQWTAFETFTPPVAVRAAMVLPGAPRYLLPFALAPPRALA